MHTGIYVRRARHDLDGIAEGAAVHLADEQVRSLHRVAGKHFSHNHAADFLSEINQFLHFEAAAKQLVLQFLRGDVDIHIFF